MLTIKTITVGDLETNCHLITDNSTSETAIVDPGDDADFITQTIINEKIVPTKIILTHGHFDHVLGCLELKLNFNIPIYLHKADEKLYHNANNSAEHWLKKSSLKVPPIDHYLSDQDEIKIAGHSLAVIHTPGHTPGSICLLDHDQKIIFVGDLIFADGVGRTDFSYSNPKKLYDSIKRIREQAPGFLAHSGHGGLFVLD